MFVLFFFFNNVQPLLSYITLQSYSTNILAPPQSPILHYHQCPSRSALTNPTQPTSSLYYFFFNIVSPLLSYITGVLAAGNSYILNYHKCPSHSALTNPLQPPMRLHFFFLSIMSYHSFPTSPYNPTPPMS